MMAPLLALLQLFAADDPAPPLTDIHLVHERLFDLRAEHLSLSFEPEPCKSRTFPFLCAGVTPANDHWWLAS
jgi:hypothetical protein